MLSCVALIYMAEELLEQFLSRWFLGNDSCGIAKMDVLKCVIEPYQLLDYLLVRSPLILCTVSNISNLWCQLKWDLKLKTGRALGHLFLKWREKVVVRIHQNPFMSALRFQSRLHSVLWDLATDECTAGHINSVVAFPASFFRWLGFAV